MKVPIRFAGRSAGAGLRLPALLIAVAVAIAGFAQVPAEAHEVRPAIVAASIGKSGGIEIRVSLNLEAQIIEVDAGRSGAAPDYDRLRGATPEALRAAFTPLAAEMIGDLGLAFDGADTELTLKGVKIPPVGDVSIARISTLVLTGTVPASAATMSWTADPRLGGNVIRVARAGESEPFFSAYLDAGEPSGPIPLQGVVEQSTWSSLASYLAIGFEHIVPKGLDHILFVVGLFLLSPHLRPLMWQVTGFTLAHSVSLALGIYGLISVPAAIVEPLIAASIVFVAVENLFTDRLQRWRPAVVFGFGLLHGLGFAGVLAEIGLPRDQFVTALIGFNLGVELGQLAVITACFLAVGLWFRHRHWYRRAIAMPASALIALVAVFWFVERVA